MLPSVWGCESTTSQQKDTGYVYLTLLIITAITQDRSKAFYIVPISQQKSIWAHHMKAIATCEIDIPDQNF